MFTLPEVYRLPLQACDLAVLSACETGVGPSQPLEAGATLANAFLMAVRGEVIASHWRVEGASSAELLGRFFEQAKDTDGKRVSYAQALQDARKNVRSSPKWRRRCTGRRSC